MEDIKLSQPLNYNSMVNKQICSFHPFFMTGITKSSIYFNDSGHIYYKKDFDKNGNLINEEGKKEK